MFVLSSLAVQKRCLAFIVQFHGVSNILAQNSLSRDIVSPSLIPTEFFSPMVEDM